MKGLDHFHWQLRGDRPYDGIVTSARNCLEDPSAFFTVVKQVFQGSRKPIRQTVCSHDKCLQIVIFQRYQFFRNEPLSIIVGLCSNKNIYW